MQELLAAASEHVLFSESSGLSEGDSGLKGGVGLGVTVPVLTCSCPHYQYSKSGRGYS